MCVQIEWEIPKMATTQTKKAKDVRIYIRATTSQKELIARAAEKEHKNSSDFVLENALSAAEAIIADDANFTLDKKRFEAFCAALDAPPRDVPSLRKLLTEKSVFDVK
jgi:uncharacterized protein (DUF1778 family)